MAATANPLAGPQEKQSLLKRLLMALPAMAQGGIDAAATPNIANGGVMDLFRAASNSSNLALERALKKSEERRAQQADIWKQADLELRQKDFERLERQGDAAIKYNEARAKQADINEQNNVIETRRTAFTNARNGNPSNTGVAPAAEKARLIASGHTILMEHPDGALLYELTDADKNAEAERKSNIPPSELDFVKAGAHRRPLFSHLETTMGQGPTPLAPSSLAKWQDSGVVGPPENTLSEMSDIPLSGVPGVTPLRTLKSPTFRTPTPEGMETLGEKGDYAYDKRVPQERSDSERVEIKGPDDLPHAMLIDSRTGEVIRDLGVVPAKPSGIGSSSNEQRAIDAYLAEHQLPDTWSNRQAAIRERAAAMQQPQRPPQGLMILDGQAFRVAPGAQVGEGAVTIAGQNSVNVPTAATRAMTETVPAVRGLTGEVKSLLDKAEKELGPLPGRWNEFATGKVGLKNVNFAEIRTVLGLLETAVMRMHVGARGGPEMLEHFHGLIGSAVQSPDNMRAMMSAVLRYADLVEHEGGLKNQGRRATPASFPSTSSAGPKPVSEMTDEEIAAEIARRRGGR